MALLNAYWVKSVVCAISYQTIGRNNMKVEISRRRFLQGSVALSVVGGSALATTSIIADDENKAELSNPLTKKVPTVCGMCVNRCTASANVRRGVVTKLDPSPYFPRSKNMLCARGAAGVHTLYDPDRLRYPLIRTGKRGDGQYRRATWDEAYEYISSKLIKILDEEKDNRSCIGYCAGQGMGEYTYVKFMKNKIGTTNFLNHDTICLRTTVGGYSLTIGAYGIADLDNAHYAILAGANRAEAIMTPDTLDLFKRTRGRGCKLTVVDPRYTMTAAHADTYVAIKPGTDLAFVLALTYQCLVDNTFNRTYVENNFSNFDKYRDHVIKNRYTPEWAQKITGVPASQIRTISREFMANGPRSIYYQGRRTTWAKNDFQLRRAQAIFTALSGSIDVKGGIVFGKKLPLDSHVVTAPLYANAKERIEKNEAAVIASTGSWSAWRGMVVDERTPYPIRAFFVYKQNPMMAVPDTGKTKKMLEKMDLVVVIDTIPGDTAMMADVILPECTYLEREDPLHNHGGIEPAIILRQKVVEPMFDTKPVLEMMHGLGKKLSKPLWEITKKYDEDVQYDLEDLAEGETEEDYYNDNGFDLASDFSQSQEYYNRKMFVPVYGEEAWNTLREKGVFYPDMERSFKKLDNNTYQYYEEDRKFFTTVQLKAEDRQMAIDECVNERDLAELKRVFKTSSRQIECFLGAMERRGIHPMPTWVDNDFVQIPKGRYKFVSGRHAIQTQSSTVNNIMLLELMKENYMWINDKDAKELGIEFGDELEVKSKAATIRIKAYPTIKIIQGIVFYVHGFGANSSALTFGHRNGASDNELIEDRFEPVFGCSIMHDTLVSIKKV